MGSQQLAEAHESAHDGNIHFDGALTGEYAGKHRYALFCEGIGASTATASVCSSNLEEQSFGFIQREMKHEVFRKTFAIAPDGFVKVAGCDLV
jgi:hypothetical protein